MLRNTPSITLFRLVKNLEQISRTSFVIVLVFVMAANAFIFWIGGPYFDDDNAPIPIPSVILSLVLFAVSIGRINDVGSAPKWAHSLLAYLYANFTSPKLDPNDFPLISKVIVANIFSLSAIFFLPWAITNLLTSVNPEGDHPVQITRTIWVVFIGLIFLHFGFFVQLRGLMRPSLKKPNTLHSNSNEVPQ